MLRFKEELAGVRAEQEKAAAATEQVKARYRQAVAERMRQAEATASRLEKLAGQAREELRQARPGTGPRSEDDYAQARDRLDDLQRALAVRDLDASLDVAKRALPPLQRLAGALHDDAFMAERYATHQKRSPEELRRSADHAAAALPPVRQVREELEKLFPDPRTVLPRGEQQKLDQLAQRQRELEQRAGRLQQQLEQLSREAPVFPPQAMQSLGEGRGHMAAAAEELGRRNPQRGHGQQREALDALGRLEKGLEEMARRGQGQGGPGFPFPFGDPGSREGEGREVASREKVEIPGAEAYKVPEEYRKDLLEAMKQGTPEPYRGEVKRYYEELVK
jgi:DNA repair exonuclease SbcCD ATPase subunit